MPRQFVSVARHRLCVCSVDARKRPECVAILHSVQTFANRHLDRDRVSACGGGGAVVAGAADDVLFLVVPVVMVFFPATTAWLVPLFLFSTPPTAKTTLH